MATGDKTTARGRTAMGGTMGQNNDRQHDDGDGQHNDGKGQQGDWQHNDGDGRYDNVARRRQRAAQ